MRCAQQEKRQYHSHTVDPDEVCHNCIQKQGSVTYSLLLMGQNVMRLHGRTKSSVTNILLVMGWDKMPGNKKGQCHWHSVNDGIRCDETAKSSVTHSLLVIGEWDCLADDEQYHLTLTPWWPWDEMWQKCECSITYWLCMMKSEFTHSTTIPVPLTHF